MRLDTLLDRPRALFARPRAGNVPAAITLVVLAPLIAELALGTIPFSQAWLILLVVPIYGAGILLLRELVHRAGRGWPSIALLGVAYEVVLDGIGIQALSSPTLYGAADWGRVLGLNLAYWEVNAVYHVVFSALIPVLLADLLFPRHRHVPYLGKPGLVVTAVVAVLGVGLLRIALPPFLDPGYTAPVAVLIGCLVVVGVLGWVALRVLPPRSRKWLWRDHRPVPGPWALAGIGLVATIVLLGLLFPFGGARQPAFTEGAWVLVPLLLAAALVAGAAVLLCRWTTSTNWTDRHALLLAGGGLVGHSVVGLVVYASTPVDRIGLVVMALLEVVLVGYLDRRMRVRPGIYR